MTYIESDVPDILVKDGVRDNDFSEENAELCNVFDVIKEKGVSRSWSKRIINTESNSATIICQLPGEGNRRHYHPNWNEWWYILQGEWLWEIDGREVIVKKNQVVFIEKNKVHKITAIGRQAAIRLAVSREDIPHIYPDEEGA